MSALELFRSYGSNESLSEDSEEEYTGFDLTDTANEKFFQRTYSEEFANRFLGTDFVHTVKSMESLCSVTKTIDSDDSFFDVPRVVK